MTLTDAHPSGAHEAPAARARGGRWVRRGMLSAVLALAVGAGLGSSAAAQARPTGVPERLPDGPSASAFTDADLVALINQTVASQLADKGIAGAVVSVVHDGAVVLSRGYGSSDTKGTQPDPARTLFRVGSVTKLFTATAVMQLVEAGKLDLDQDIDSYLDFRVSGAQPITLRHLLTHTAGFEDASIGYLRAPGPQSSRSAWLKDHVPALVRPLGSSPPTPTTAWPWPATSCSVSPACPTRSTSRHTSSTRSG